MVMVVKPGETNVEFGNENYVGSGIIWNNLQASTQMALVLNMEYI